MRESPFSESEDSEEVLSVSAWFWGRGGGGGKWQRQRFWQGQGKLGTWGNGGLNLGGNWEFRAT